MPKHTLTYASLCTCACAFQVTEGELARHQRALEQKMAVLEATRELKRTWVHVDMDAFFAAVEELANPALVCVSLSCQG